MNISAAQFPPKFPNYFDSTMVAAALSCERQFYLEYVRGLRPKVPNIHLAAGSAFAKGVETFRLAFYTDEVDSVEAYAAAWSAAIAEWGDFPDDPEHPKALHRVLEALWCYFFEWYPPHTDLVQPYRDVGGFPAIEINFSLPLPDCYHPDTAEPIFYVGRLDMLGMHNGAPFVVDEKTTSQLGTTWTRNWELRSQFTGYCWAVEQILKVRPAGAIVRGVGFLKTQQTTAEVITLREPWLTEQWLTRTVRVVQRIINTYMDDRLNTNNTFLPDLDTACTAYGGCRFFTLCTKADPTPWLDEYHVDRWDPLART